MHRRWLGLLGAASALLLGGASPARADFTVNLCGGNPGPPWVNGQGTPEGLGWSTIADNCQQPGGTEVFAIGSGTLASNALPGAEFNLPSGEVFTHIHMTFEAEPYDPNQATGGDETKLAVVANTPGGASPQDQLMDAVTSAAASPLDADVSGGTGLIVGVFCTTSPHDSNCTYDNPATVLTINGLALTMKDVTVPVISSTSGLSSGTVSGSNSIAYQASDSGSGIASVSVALGATTLATATSNCQFNSLQPCPASANGTLSVDTTKVADGAYPVVVTATDASGDATTHQAGTITVANGSSPPPPASKPQTGTGTTPVGGSKRGHRHRAAASVDFKVEWEFFKQGTTAVKHVSLAKLPAGATLAVSCAGQGCPIRRITADSAKTLATLVRTLTGPRFTAGDKVTFEVTRKGRPSIRDVFKIVRWAKPVKLTGP